MKLVSACGGHLLEEPQRDDVSGPPLQPSEISGKDLRIVAEMEQLIMLLSLSPLLLATRQEMPLTRCHAIEFLADDEHVSSCLIISCATINLYRTGSCSVQLK